MAGPVRSGTGSPAHGDEEVCYESLVAVIDYPRIIVLGVYVCRSAGGRKGMNMTETIIVALITGGLSLLGVIITSNKTTRDVQAKLDTHQAVTDTKLEELTREVREHNNFARRVPVLEEQIKVANHRIADLENNH
nr:MAG TPA: hypothetical protein [Caudoviricetes sp.]